MSSLASASAQCDLFQVHESTVLNTQLQSLFTHSYIWEMAEEAVKEDIRKRLRQPRHKA